ncbi:LipA and NB-ARC domain-containing protein [Colletotrichum musicola]|uniref:LipA and NB-ARC domain-containing protein n=1 Tax=Colletotrichum musicola TaxID=2175873 RepID=A0A8H6KV78_9PEZI|nr:LipA and NB-ARC domain-containing protein [Colletotrichum musicola]
MINAKLDFGSRDLPPTSLGYTIGRAHGSRDGSIQDLPSPREPPFVHPDRFRPNSFFKGREEELRDLHRMLMDKKRRSEGTSAVLIQGIPGAGKTHLARQYVFNHKDDYPAGIYWIRSTTLQDMEDGFWRIAKDEAIREMVDKENKHDLSNPQNMVKIVRSWFNDYDGWLLVFDGIRFDDPDVQDFIPDRKNTSLIFTSTERAVEGDHLLDNPRVMKLNLLPVQDAQELLLEEMGKKQPYTTDDLSRALDLVQMMDRLPLMIHAAAQQMNTTREPLAKYVRGFKRKPKVGGMLPAYTTIRDQLQHRGDTSALNLIYILSFFSQLVPVEMLALGLEALDKRTPVKTDTTGHKRSLTRTLVTLIKFALIERNEMDDIPSSSSRDSRQSVDVTEDPLDVLRIHSVVQAFFVQLLDEEKQLAFWLERAIRVFCHSFDEADSIMKRDPATGLPDDYRRYAIHGKKLMEHLDRLHKPMETFNGNVVDLAAAKSDLKARLARLPEEIDGLQRIISSNIVDGKQVVEHSSVFERSNSMSSLSTDNSNGARLSLYGRLPGEDYVQHESPTTYDGSHHFHMPDHRIPQIEEPQSEDQFPDDRTVTPYPPDIISDYPDSKEPEWTLVSNHRSVKKIKERRYHDRGGSWREGSVNDPRVSVNRETARGLISPPGSTGEARSRSRSRLSAGSEAEAKLSYLYTRAPALPRGGGNIYKGRSSSVSSAGTVASIQPRSDRPSYAEPLSDTAIQDEAPLSPTISNPLSRAGTLDRMATYDSMSIDSLRTVDVDVPSSTTYTWHRTIQTQPCSTTHPPDESRTNNRTADGHGQEGRSIPSMSYLSSVLSRFRRPASEPKTSITRSGKSKEHFKPESPVSKQPENQPATYQGGTRTANSGLNERQPPSYPGLQDVTNSSGSLQHDSAARQHTSNQLLHGYYPEDHYDEALSRPDLSIGRPAVNISSPATTVLSSPVFSRSPDGYTSQPMTRNTSSNHPVDVSSRPSGISPRSNSGSRASLNRSPVPSLVETEPSPRIIPLDMSTTSYDAWTRRENGNSRRCAPLVGGNKVPVSHWLADARIPSFEAPPESPGLTNTRTIPRIATGGENMVRSGSGGIRLDGRIISFGDIPVDIAAASRREARYRERLQQTAMLARDDSDGAGSSTDAPPVGLGIMPR